MDFFKDMEDKENLHGVQPDAEVEKGKNLFNDLENGVPAKQVRGVYGMYTEKGNDAVKQIIEKIKNKRSRFEMANDGDKLAVIYLRTLAKNKGFEEAKDDVVKFKVFNEVRKRK